jgi:hypothetical protein
LLALSILDDAGYLFLAALHFGTLAHEFNGGIPINEDENT